MLKRLMIFAMIFVASVSFGKIQQKKRQLANEGNTASDQVWFLDYTHGLTAEKMSD